MSHIKVKTLDDIYIRFPWNIPNVMFGNETFPIQWLTLSEMKSLVYLESTTTGLIACLIGGEVIVQ